MLSSSRIAERSGACAAQRSTAQRSMQQSSTALQKPFCLLLIVGLLVRHPACRLATQ